jgi:acyl-CoA synthetase (AMP-forming)/AMP-acid ligase II
MITTGGENVYGPEVERLIMAHPAISDTAVIGVPTIAGANPSWRL